MEKLDFLMNPWPWWLTGPLIGLAVPLMILVGGRNLGISSSFRHICPAVLPRSSLAYFRSHDWRKESWSLFFVAGLALGAFSWTGASLGRAVSMALLFILFCPWVVWMGFLDRRRAT